MAFENRVNPLPSFAPSLKNENVNSHFEKNIRVRLYFLCIVD